MKTVSRSLASVLIGAATLMLPAPHAAQTPPSPGSAQSTAPSVTQARNPRVLVLTYFDRVGVRMAESVRSRIRADTSGTAMTVIPQQKIEDFLRASGYPTLINLNATDARALGRLVRADVRIVLTLSQDSDSIRMQAGVAGANELTTRPLTSTVSASVESLSAQMMLALQSDSTYLRLRRRLD
ncbi:MAG: hypothetical protein IPP90_05215 [Gemmatimonadaceae bacterium]|nr:hypothetical protein [Gemmatimonadaceae bacterium]